MANKFLPFIVETSSPVHILKTLLSRSKGMNNNLVASMLYLIFTTELSKLRDIVKELPDMPLEQIYEELLIKFPNRRVAEEDVQMFLAIHKWFPPDNDHWVLDLEIFDIDDVMLFFLAMSLATLEKHKDLKDYTSVPFHKLLATGSASYVEDVLNNISVYVHFDDNGVVISCDSELDLKSFVLYRALIASAMEPMLPERIFCAHLMSGWDLLRKNS